MAAVVNWPDHYVGRELLDPRTLATHPYQWRTHSAEQERALDASINRLGLIGAPAWNRRTGHLMNGHERRDLAIKRGLAAMPVEVYDMSEEEENLAIAVLDSVAGLAIADRDALRETLAHAATDDADLRRFLADLAERDAKPFVLPQAATPAPPAPVVECVIEIRCRRDQLDGWRATLSEWSAVPGVTLSIS